KHSRRDRVDTLQAAEDQQRIAIEEPRRLQPAEPEVVLLHGRFKRAARRLLGPVREVLRRAGALKTNDLLLDATDHPLEIVGRRAERDIDVAAAALRRSLRQ